ncbi:glutathione S-transferase family protein [Nisaea acidiphila]|uniref:Glutathione S-transferase family protein n=1 Tax=Nisaea acidiphila TaxID=1862145 RepID=A0A9J7AR15_9PROT|nr:glutathione S-transferase family protein [Nisaea acidiphila]UUX49630.1 glutathione S-transferase family protein [Nisaea acidiphila]
MKLLGQPNSINVRKVLWTCAELGLAPEIETWGGDRGSTHDQEFLTINPKGLVPVLLDGDLTLSESNTICRYLATRENRAGLLPADPEKRALVESWMDWQAAELNGAWKAAFMGLVRKDPNFSDSEIQLASVRTWNAQMALLEEHLASHDPYICGANLTLADIVLALSTNRWEMTPMEKPILPNIANWMERLSKRPGFRAHCRNGVP